MAGVAGTRSPGVHPHKNALDGVSVIVGGVEVLVELLVTELFSILFPLPLC